MLSAEGYLCLIDYVLVLLCVIHTASFSARSQNMYLSLQSLSSTNHLLHFSKSNCLEITSNKKKVQVFIVKSRVKISFFPLELFCSHDNSTGQTMAPTDIYQCYGNNTYQNVAEAVAVYFLGNDMREDFVQALVFRMDKAHKSEAQCSFILLLKQQ